MQSKKRVELLDTFEQDVPTTVSDNEALWQVRDLNQMNPDEYLEFLLAFTAHLTPSRETNSDSDEPFTL